MMKNKWIALMMALLLLAAVPGARASTVIQRPDQYFTIMVYRSAAVERMPGTEITSFERDQNDMVYTTSSGAMNGDKVGKTTLFLEEYDSEKDIYYHSRIHVTVEPLDKTIEWERDQSANSAEMKAWVKDNGHVFAVGQRYSVKTACIKDGKSLKVTYSSNRPEVASVDENGMVTMNAPGTANITYQAEGYPGFDCFLIVHDGDAWEHTYGYYEPADPGARLNVYKKADETSQVVATMGRWESDNFFVFSRGEEWSRISLNGKIGYVKTAELHFRDQAAANENREIQVPCTMYVNAQSLGKLDLVSQPSRGSWLGEYATDTPVYVTEITDGFAKVTVEGKTGYMNLTFLSSIKPENVIEDQSQALQGKPMEVYVPGGEALKVWGDKGASLTGNQVGSLKNGEVVLMVGKLGDHAEIVYNGKIAYALKKFLVEPADEKESSASKGVLMHVNATGDVPVYSEPKTSAALMQKIPNGTEVMVYTASGGWSLVNLNGYTGYIQSQFLLSGAGENPATPSAGNMIVQTGNTGKLFLRAKPKAGTAILGKYPNGTYVTVHEIMGEWGRVTVQGKQGYMMLKFLASAPNSQPEEEKKEETEAAPTPGIAKTMVVQTGNTGKLYLRAEPKAGARILDKYPNGTLLVLYETEGEWGRVLIEGKQGYMMVKFLAKAPVKQPEEEKKEETKEEITPPVQVPTEEEKPETPAVPEDKEPPEAEEITPPLAANSATVTHPKGSFVNLRSGPHTDYRALAQIKHGTRVEVLEKGEYWSKIRVNGQEGYMVSNYLK